MRNRVGMAPPNEDEANIMVSKNGCQKLKMETDSHNHTSQSEPNISLCAYWSKMKKLNCCKDSNRMSKSCNQERSNNISTSTVTTPTNTSKTTPTRPLERLLVKMLPFLFVFLLPTFRMEPKMLFLLQSSDVIQLMAGSESLMGRLLQTNPNYMTSDLLATLIRLPFDRLKLQSIDLIGGADAKEVVNSKSDLQEEETHLLMLAPAEHRSSYVQSGGGGAGHPSYHHQFGSGGESGQQHELQAAAAAAAAGPQLGAASSASNSPDYAGPEEHGGVGAVLPQTETGLVSEAAAASSSALQARSDLPAVRALNVKCEKNHMTVNIVFDRPFYGMVFSKGHYNDQKCVHLPPNSGQTSINFDIHLGKCGMSSSDATGSSSTGLQQAATTTATGPAGGQQQQPNGVYIENTIIIQYDPLVQEIYDQARKLRCTWYDYYEKSVTFRPYNVDMLDAVTANFLGDNIQCWMQIQVGKGPWSSEVAGIVKIGQTMTMVLAIKDDENRFDMLVRNCVAHDGKHQPIQLVDEYGCVARPKIMGKFQKVRNFGPAATVVSYAHFQAFKFPDSMSVHFQCVIQVCRYECPEPVCSQPAELGASNSNSGSNSQNGNQLTGANDYATSGTEMVASKEPLPMPNYYPTSSLTNQSHGSNVNLKLDESQGRVQVKLDTSMMAGLNSRTPQALINQQLQSGNAMPPHLLHMAASSAAEQQTGARGYPSSSHYRPVVGAASTHQSSSFAIASPSTGGAPIVGRQHSASLLMPPASRQQHINLAPAPPVSSISHQASNQVLQFSPQFGAANQNGRRSSISAAYSNRLGDLARDVGENTSRELANEHPQIMPPYEAEYPLSLLGSPRGLPLGATTLAMDVSLGQNQAHHPHPHQRVKRDDKATTLTAQATSEPTNKASREARHLKPDSTSVQTQRTIQVVSPDDVAFSLLDPSEDYDQQTSGRQSVLHPMRKTAHTSDASSVCFSTSRFLWAILITIGLLVSSIVVVTYVILKQRSQLDRKLSSVFVSNDLGLASSNQKGLEESVGYAPIQADNHHSHNLRQQMMAHHRHESPSSSISNLCGSSSNSMTSQQQQQQDRFRRQQAEIQQRNTYLSRLYSQFAPANYWR